MRLERGPLDFQKINRGLLDASFKVARIFVAGRGWLGTDGSELRMVPGDQRFEISPPQRTLAGRAVLFEGKLVLRREASGQIVVTDPPRLEIVGIQPE